MNAVHQRGPRVRQEVTPQRLQPDLTPRVWSPVFWVWAHVPCFCQLKKCTTREVWSVFGAIWGVPPRRQQLRQLWETAPKRQGDGQSVCDFGEGGVHGVKHIFLWKVSPGLMKLLLVMRNSRHREGFQCFLDMRSYKNWAHRISSWKDLTTKDLSCQFAGAQRASFLPSTLNSFRALEVISCSGSWLNPRWGRWQAHGKCQLVVDTS